jgi:hypothetical protein
VVVPLIRGRASAIINFDSQYGTCTAQGAVGSASITFKGSDGVILRNDLAGDFRIVELLGSIRKCAEPIACSPDERSDIRD